MIIADTGRMRLRIQTSNQFFDSSTVHIRLAGSRCQPDDPMPLALMLLISGSGPQDRDQHMAGQLPFLHLREQLDLRINAEADLQAIDQALRHDQYQIKQIAGLNHLFQSDNTGARDNDTRLGDPFADELMKPLEIWLKTCAQSLDMTPKP